MRRGAATALLGLGFLLMAAVFDAEPLYVPGVAFAALAGGSALWVWAGARGLRLTRTVGARRVLEEQRVTIDVEVPVGLIEDDLLPGPAPIAARGRVTHVRIQARFARRGPKRLEPPRVVVSDPFGLATRTVVGDEADELLVLPMILPVTATGGSGDGSGLAARRARRAVAAEVDLDGLRPYREGAPASRIFWPGVARGAEMMERRLRADGDTRPLVVLDPRSARVEDDLDAAVRATASLCVHLARRGGCALLLPGDRRPTVLEPSLGGWAHLHVRLALVGPDRAPSTGGLATRRGPVLYVAARVPARPPRALAHAPGGGRLLIVPGRYGTLPAVFEVAGCRAYELSGARQRTEVA
jgi:uncharacterized protein (DUF58 family)